MIVVECFFGDSGNGKVFLDSQVILQEGLPWVGCPWVYPGNGKVSLESEVTFPGGSTRVPFPGTIQGS